MEGERLHLWKSDADNAIADLTQFIPLNPAAANGYRQRGSAWVAKKDVIQGIKDFNEALRLDPNDLLALLGRGRAWKAKKDFNKAIDDFNECLRLRPDRVLYCGIFGHFAARKHSDDKAAKRFLNETALQINNEAWPFPAIRCLRSEIDEPALLKSANQDGEKTEAHCYLGLDHALKGHKAEALTHFRWVKIKASRRFL